MKEFTEMHHAFIVASYYKRLIQEFGDRGLQAFIHATHIYAQQRGSRMAQRAIRDGKSLTFNTYREYGEWESTHTTREEMGGFDSKIISVSPDYEEHIMRCPWAYKFKMMGMKDCGTVYCTYLDTAIARGFNPYLTFDVPQSVNNKEYCIQIMRDANLKDGMSFKKNKENIKGFNYHCGHVYKTFGSISNSIFGKENKTLSAEVLDDFSKEYGGNMASILESFSNIDFNII